MIITKTVYTAIITARIAYQIGGFVPERPIVFPTASERIENKIAKIGYTNLIMSTAL